MHSLRMNIGDYITAKTFSSRTENKFSKFCQKLHLSIVDLSWNIFPNKWFSSFGNLLWLKYEQVVIKASEMANEIFWRLGNINFMIQFSAELLDIHLFKATDKLEMLLKLLEDDVESFQHR